MMHPYSEDELVEQSAIRVFTENLNYEHLNCYEEKFQTIIDAYNTGSMNQETFFNELMKFSNNLKDEERKIITEDLTEEELALFDKLKKPVLGEKRQKSSKKNRPRSPLHTQTQWPLSGRLEKKTTNTNISEKRNRNRVR